MSEKKRIYLVRNTETAVERLVRAANVAQARNHVARDTLAVEVASQSQLVTLLTATDPIPIEDSAQVAAD